MRHKVYSSKVKINNLLNTDFVLLVYCLNLLNYGSLNKISKNVRGYGYRKEDWVKRKENNWEITYKNVGNNKQQN